MSVNELPQTISEARSQLSQGVFSATELTQSFLRRMDQTEPLIHAMLTITASQALKQAGLADERLARGERGGLLGIPLVHKDNFMTHDVRTTAASRILDNHIAAYDATVVDKLSQAGAVMLGKANLDAFAHGSSTENSDFGATFNPWDRSLVPGGSSGGSAASIAAQQCLVATGSDTGGSIRQPASFTNLVGIKPTYGRVSRYGVIAMGSSFDSIGCLARTVEDCSIVLQSMAGKDTRDATTSSEAVLDYGQHLSRSLKGLVFGIADEFYTDALDPEIARAMEESRRVFESLGVVFKRVSLPYLSYALSVYYILVPSEVSANLERFDGIRYGYSAQDATSLLEMYEQTRAKGLGAEAKRRIMLGTYALSSGYYDAYYKKAQQARTLVKQNFDQVLSEVDGLLAPVSPILPFKLGEKTADPLAMYLSDILTVPVNLAGLPSLALPCGFSGRKPIGMQLIGRNFSEAALFNWGHMYQSATAWHEQLAEVLV